jgi:hypothetical protein
MPIRIRSTGMGIALLLNQGVSTLIAALFLPVVGNYGFYAIFFFWTACTMFYFFTAGFFLPETKGKTLEVFSRVLTARYPPEEVLVPSDALYVQAMPSTCELCRGF